MGEHLVCNQGVGGSTPLRSTLDLEGVKRYEVYDFSGVRASEGVFGVHKHPAMLHFKLVRSLLEEFSDEGDTVYDPFCGSGTTLNVAVRMGRFAIVTDINPLALLISKVRSYVDVAPEPFLKTLEEAWDDLRPEIPKVKNLYYWFKPYVIEALGKIRAFLRKVPSGREREFLLVVFSQTVREVSLTRKGEFKRYRIPPSAIPNFNPDILQTFLRLAHDYLQRPRESEPPRASMRVYLHDVRRPLPFTDRVDLVVTSPPYGDSKTTVAYGEFFSFSMDWLRGLVDLPTYRLDKVSLGGNSRPILSLPPSPTLRAVVNEIAGRDKRRANQTALFYADLFKAISNVVDNLSDGGTVCFVVGNRRMKGLTVPMDRIVREMFEYLGLKHYETRVRWILNKRMPSQNSPSNVRGKTDSTMHEEYIVMMGTG